MPDTPTPDLPMTERDWQRFVIDLAQLHRWRVAHFRPAMTSQGWRTPVEADGAGFPDLVLVRERVVYVECKADRGRLGLEQELWIDALKAAGQDVRVWRPRDEAEVWQCLTGRIPGTTAPTAGLRVSTTSSGRIRYG